MTTTISSVVISKGNSKVGNIPSFSLPALTTCPGKTSWCSANCYAHKISRIYPNVRKSYEKNLEASQSDTFVATMNTELTKLTKKGVKTFRIHVSGDLYSNEYINSWIQIISANPEMTFYSYTRSWRITELHDKLEELKALPNMTLFASLDTNLQMHIPMLKTWRKAFAGDSNTQNKSFVTCLEQAGKAESCEKCGLCFKSGIKNSNINIYFKTH